MKAKKWLFLPVWVIVAVAYARGVYCVNAQVEQIPCKIYNLGEKVSIGENMIFGDTMDGYFVRVLSAEPLTREMFMERYHATRNQMPDFDIMPLIYEVEVEISNEGNMKTGIDLNELYLQNKAALISFDPTYYRLANAEFGYESTSIAVRDQTTVSLRLEFPMLQYNFKKKMLKNPEKLDLRLVVSLYPEKKELRLQ